MTTTLDDSLPATEESIAQLWGLLVGQRYDQMSQAEMGRQLGITAPGVCKMESRPKAPFLHTIQRYAAILGYEVRITLRKRP